MKLILILFGAALLAGCQSHRTRSLDAYNAQLQEIEQAKQAGQISTAEYLKLKQDAENAWRHREGQRRQAAATILAD